MAFQRFQKKLELLRQQPEHVRLRAATRFTVVGGLVIVAAWLAILLPLQLRLSWRTGDSSAEQAALEALQSGPAIPSDTGVVSGAQDAASPTPEGNPEYFQGTRPSLRQPASGAGVDGYASPTPPPSPSPEDPNQPVELTP